MTCWRVCGEITATAAGMADRADKARQRLLQYGSSAGPVGLLTAGPSASGLGGPSQSYGGGTQAGFGATQAGGPGGPGGGRVPLSQRLKLSGAEGDNAKLPIPLLKKYVQYARTYCHPRLSEEAKQVLQVSEPGGLHGLWVGIVAGMGVRHFVT